MFCFESVKSHKTLIAHRLKISLNEWIHLYRICIRRMPTIFANHLWPQMQMVTSEFMVFNYKQRYCSLFHQKHSILCDMLTLSRFVTPLLILCTMHNVLLYVCTMFNRKPYTWYICVWGFFFCFFCGRKFFSRFVLKNGCIKPTAH